MSKRPLNRSFLLISPILIVLLLFIKEYFDDQEDPLTLMTDHFNTAEKQTQFQKVMSCQKSLFSVIKQTSPLALQIQRCIQQTHPSLLIARGQMHSTGLIPKIDIEVFDLFSTDSSKECLRSLSAPPIAQKKLKSLFALSKDIRIDFELELMKSDSDSIHIQNMFGCNLSLMDASEHPKETQISFLPSSPLRKSIYVEGTPLSADPLNQMLRKCDQQLSSKDQNTLFQIRRITSNQTECKVDESNSIRFAQYDQCICDVFSGGAPNQSNPLSSELTVTYTKNDGTAVSKTYQAQATDPLVPYWFIRKGPEPAVFYKIKRVQPSKQFK